MRRLVLLALVAASVAAGTARAGAPTVPPGAVAVVAGETVTRVRLDELLVSARRSYGARFPARGTSAYRRIQDDAVGFLVAGPRSGSKPARSASRSRLPRCQLASSRSSSSISAALSASTGRSLHVRDSRRVRRANVRRQLLGQRIYAAVVGDVMSDAAAAASWADWLDTLHARYAPLVAYAPGFGPS